jgi:hypothetical protein
MTAWQQIRPIVLIVTIIGLVPGLGLPAYAWPEGTTETDKTTIMTARTMDDLSTEQYGIAIDRVDEIFDYFSPDRQEYKDLLDCGYVDKEAFQVLQCWEGKGWTVR